MLMMQKEKLCAGGYKIIYLSVFLRLETKVFYKLFCFRNVDEITSETGAEFHPQRA